MDNSSTPRNERLVLALVAAREAGHITLEYFQTDRYRVERKGDNSPVTEADRAAEQHLRGLIGRAFSDDAILGEEFGQSPGVSGYRWILDPIDGTKSFISGVPLYGTLVGLERDGQPLAGVIHIPALGETVWGALGGGAWHQQGNADPVPARVSTATSLSKSLFCTSEVRTFDERGRRAAYDRLQDAARLSRTWGDCYGYLLVATGRAELMVDPALNVWDAAALLPILEEAGGAFTDWQGRRTIHSSEGIGACPGVLAEVLAITRGA